MSPKAKCRACRNLEKKTPAGVAGGRLKLRSQGG